MGSHRLNSSHTTHVPWFSCLHGACYRCEIIVCRNSLILSRVDLQVLWRVGLRLVEKLRPSASIPKCVHLKASPEDINHRALTQQATDFRLRLLPPRTGAILPGLATYSDCGDLIT